MSKRLLGTGKMRCHKMVSAKMKAHLWFILICIPDLQHRASTFKKPHIELSAHMCLLASPEHLPLFWQNINLPTFLL